MVIFGALRFLATTEDTLPISFSQFFVTLTADPAKLKKLTGKYVAFGMADLEQSSSKECLEALNALADGKGGTIRPVWIAECGLQA